MHTFQRFCAAAAFAACAIAPTAANAAKVLFLSTAEFTDDDRVAANLSSYNGAYSGQPYINNLKESLKIQLSPDDFLDRSGVLSIDSQIEALNTLKETKDLWKKADNWENNGGKAAAENDFLKLESGDVVVVNSIYNLIDSTKAAFIVEKMKTRGDLTFILIIDSCTQCGWSMDTKTNDASANRNLLLTPVNSQSLHSNVKHSNVSEFTHNWTSILNESSPYASKIQLKKLMGHANSSVQCVPRENILFPTPMITNKNNSDSAGWYCDTQAYYTCTNGKKTCDPEERSYIDKDTNEAYMAAYWSSECDYTKDTTSAQLPEINASSAFSILIPHWQSNNGKGACIFYQEDSSSFDDPRGGKFGAASSDYWRTDLSQYSKVAKMFLSLPTGACKVVPDSLPQEGSGIKCNSPADGCILVDAPAGTPDKDLAVLDTKGADGSTMCEAKIWCDADVDNRSNYCGEGENSSTHCCKPKICQPPEGCASAPAAGWPAMLGLGAVLPLLAAARRRRRK